MELKENQTETRWAENDKRSPLWPQSTAKPSADFVFLFLLEHSNNHVPVYQATCTEFPQPKLEVTLRGYLEGMQTIRKMGFYIRNKQLVLQARAF